MNLHRSESGVFEATELPMQPVHRILEEGVKSRVRREQEFSVNMSGNTCLCFVHWSEEEGHQCTVQYILLALQVSVCQCSLYVSVCACECVSWVPVLAVLPGWVVSQCACRISRVGVVWWVPLLAILLWWAT